MSGNAGRVQLGSHWLSSFGRLRKSAALFFIGHRFHITFQLIEFVGDFCHVVHRYYISCKCS